MKAKESTDNLCDTCDSNNFPNCIPANVVFGNGKGNDNIIECDRYEKEKG